MTMQVGLNDIIDITNIPVSQKGQTPGPVLSPVLGSFQSVQDTSRQKTFPAFYAGEDAGWTLRFSPDRIGTWEYTIYSLPDEVVIASGVVECTMSPVSGNECHLVSRTKTRGALMVSPDQHDILTYQDGTPYFPIAYECDWLFALWMKDQDVTKAFIDRIKACGFNMVIMNIYAHACTWTDPATPGRLVPPPVYVWGGTNEDPDHSRINTAFFDLYDGLMVYLRERGLISHLYFFVYNKEVSLPAHDSLEEQLYVQHIVARYQAFDTVVWDFAKETYLVPDKDYVYRKLRLIKEWDGHRRLLTVHDDKIMFRDPTWSSLIDFHTLQQHQDFTSEAIREAQLSQKPVMNAEFGYESGKGGVSDRTYTESLPIAEYMHRAYATVLAKAGVCYYYTFTGWDVIRPEDSPPGYHSWKALSEFIQAVDWWNYQPRPELCLWTPTACMKHRTEDKFLILVNHHGKFLLGYDAAHYEFSGEWMHIVSGERRKLCQSEIQRFEITPEFTLLSSPFGAQAVLMVTIVPRRSPSLRTWA